MRPLSKVLLLFLFFGSFSLHAQFIPNQDSVSAKPYVYIELLNGEDYEGFLLEQNSERLIIINEQGLEIRIKMLDVKSIEFERAETIKESHYNLQASRYFFGPNALSMRRGEGYYQNNWVFLNQVSFGLSDRFTIGAGTIPLFIFGYGAPTPIWITPKFSMPIIPGKVNAAVGGLFGTIAGEDDFNSTFGIGYGAFTLGNHDRNINLSVGYGMADGVWSDYPTISLSGMARLSKKFYLITENYFIFDTYLFSLGGRSIWSEVSLDYGFIASPQEFEALIPWLGITVPFRFKDKQS
jgi:hypothetical protein